MKFTLKIFLFFLTLFFINHKNYIIKSKEINNDQKQFLNIFIDKELNGSMNNFLNNLGEQTKLIVNIKYIDSNSYINNLKNLDIDVIITKENIHNILKKEKKFNKVLNIGKLKYSICLFSENANIRSEIIDLDKDYTDEKTSFAKAFSEINKIFEKNNEKILIGLVKQNIFQGLNFNKISINNNFQNFFDLFVAFKKQKVNFAVFPEVFCSRCCENNFNAFSLEFDQNSIKNTDEYKIFSTNEISEIISTKLNSDLTQFFRN